MSDRVLSWRLGREMNAEEIGEVAGGGCKHTPRTVCTTWDGNFPDHSECDGGIDCDF